MTARVPLSDATGGDEKPLPPRHIARRPRERSAPPLSLAQERLWFLEQFEPESAFYNICSSFEIPGGLNTKALARSLDEIVCRHEVLRTTFRVEETRPVQIVAPSAHLRPQVSDLRGLPEELKREELSKLARMDARRPFDLKRGPLLRVTAVRLAHEQSVLLLTMHHIVSDGWSMGVFSRELKTLYQAFCRGDGSPLAELPIQYTDYTLWQRQHLQGEVLEGHLGYWRQQLQGAPELLELPTDRPRPAVQSFHGAAHSFHLGTALQRDLQELSRSRKVTLFITLLAAFQVLLARYTRQGDLVVGCPTANRTRPELEGLIGFFANTLVLRTDLSDDPSFEEILQRVREVSRQAYAHQELPYEKLVEELRLQRDLSRNPLFQAMFGLQSAPGGAAADGEKAAPADSGLAPISTGTAKFDLLLSMAAGEHGLLGELEYNTALFEAATIERVAGHFHTLLKGIQAAPERPLSALPLMSDEERRQVIVRWNDTGQDYGAPRCLHEWVEEQAERTPKTTAVVFEGQRLSYAELNERANRLAHHLRDLGVRPEVCVGVCAERSLNLVVGLLGVLKAGAAYLPLDPDYPPQRLAFMIEDAGVELVLTQEGLEERLPETAMRRFRLDTDWPQLATQPASNPVPTASPDNLAYVIYTSGSTGRPKGVMIRHRGIANRIQWAQQTYRLHGQDRVLQKTPFSFDVSVWEFFWPLMIGARMVLAKPGGHRDCAYLVELIQREQVSVMHLVTPMLRVFVEWPGLEDCESLRLVICGGESLIFETQQRFYSRLRAELHNLYGPTEASVDVTYWGCERHGQPCVIPIGRPIANTGIYLLDADFHPVAVGIPGELYIAGISLARGYLNRPGLSAEKFLPDPFSSTPGDRLYRTGDLARHRSGGNIDFLGRIDHQVKVRGFRIELDEIDAALGQHPEIRQSVVVVWEPTPGDKRLVAYAVAGEQPNIAELRDFLKDKLPEYMVPSFFVMLEKLPMLPNGKLNRHALPAPDKASEQHEVFVAPRQPTEKVLARIWAKVLGVERVGAYDNFFDLGGRSLLALRLVSRVRDTFQTNLPLRCIFEAPTLGGFAAALLAEADTPRTNRKDSRALAAPLPARRRSHGEEVPEQRVVHEIEAVLAKQGDATERTS